MVFGFSAILSSFTSKKLDTGIGRDAVEQQAEY